MLPLLLLLACAKPTVLPDPAPAAEPVEPVMTQTGGGGGSTGLGGAGIGAMRSGPEPMSREAIAVDETQQPVVQLVQRALRGGEPLVGDPAAISLLSQAGWPGKTDPNDLWTAIRADCRDVTWGAGEGYGAVAVAPAMVDDTPEQAALQERAIDLLQGTTEVSASCTIEVHEEECWGATEDGDAGCETFDDAYEATLLSIALHHLDGAWRVVGWRNHTAENPLAH